MTYTMLPATEDDARELAPLLRAADAAELAAQNFQPIEALIGSLRGSTEAWTARDASGRIIAMAGVGPETLIGHTGIPWLLGSDLVAAHRRAFLVETRRMVARWVLQFPVLRNRVDARYIAALRWLAWLGFEIGPPYAMGQGVFRDAWKTA